MASQAFEEFDRNFNRWIRLRHVRELLAIAKAGSISRAANELNISQPALSKSLQDIETNIGGKLFVRTNRGLVPNDFGALFLSHCKSIDIELKRASDGLKAHATGAGGHVAVGAYMVALPKLFPTMLTQLRLDGSNISCKLIGADTALLESSLIAGDIDFIVGRPPSLVHAHRLVHEVLYFEKLCVICGPEHPLRKCASLKAKDLLEYPWIFPHPVSAAFSSLIDMFSSKGLPNPTSTVETASYLLIRTLLQDQLTLASMPVDVIARDVELGELAVLPIEMPRAEISVGITHFAGREHSAAALHVIRSLREVAQTSHGQA